MNLNNIELDLNDPKVAAAVKAADVDKKPAPAEDTTAKKIASLQKGASVTIKLTTEQLAMAIRQVCLSGDGLEGLVEATGRERSPECKSPSTNHQRSELGKVNLWP